MSDTKIQQGIVNKMGGSLGPTPEPDSVPGLLGNPPEEGGTLKRPVPVQPGEPEKWEDVPRADCTDPQRLEKRLVDAAQDLFRYQTQLGGSPVVQTARDTLRQRALEYVACLALSDPAFRKLLDHYLSP